MTADFDYSEFQDEDGPGENLMTRIEGLAKEAVDAEVRVAHLIEQLAEANASLKLVLEKKLPELLDEADLGESTINTPAGHEIKMSTIIRGSISKDNQAKAFKWLEDNNNGGLIKRNIIIDFGKGEEKWADKFERDCAQRKKPLNLKRKMAVNPQTLQAFVRQSLEEGVKIPMEILGVYRQRMAKVKVKADK